MSDKEKKIVDSENIILEEYIKSGIFNSKFWLYFIFILFQLSFLLFLNYMFLINPLLLKG